MIYDVSFPLTHSILNWSQYRKQFERSRPAQTLEPPKTFVSLTTLPKHWHLLACAIFPRNPAPFPAPQTNISTQKTLFARDMRRFDTKRVHRSSSRSAPRTRDTSAYSVLYGNVISPTWTLSPVMKMLGVTYGIWEPAPKTMKYAANDVGFGISRSWVSHLSRFLPQIMLMKQKVIIHSSISR